MKARRALIGLFQKMSIKNLMRVSEVSLQKLDSFTLETSKNQLIRNFRRNGRVRVKLKKIIIIPTKPIPADKKKNPIFIGIAEPIFIK